jgi:F-type H+-transporting ATPase subunit epsilon
VALQLLVVTPERKVVDAEADEVELPGSEGYLGVLPGHTPLLTLLKTGVLTYRQGGRSRAYAVSSGFAEIAADRISVLADLAESSGEIDAAAVERERASAMEELKTAGADTLEDVRRRFLLAEARLAVARRPS